MAVIRPYLSIITLSVNGLNSPIKRCRVTEYIKKTNKKRRKPKLYAVYNTLALDLKRSGIKLKVKLWFLL